MPSVPAAGIPMTVASTSQPGVASSSTASSAAPASIAIDFMSMLGQLAGAAAPTPASTAMQTPALPALKDSEELDTTEPESTDMLGMMPLSLPVMPTEVKVNSGVQATALLGVAGSMGKAAEAVAPEAQLLTDLIQPEQAQGKFEIPHLSTTAETTSSARQADAAHSRPVHVPVGTAAWADEIGSRMTMMVEQGKH